MKLNLISFKIIKSSKSIEAEVGGGNSLWVSSQSHCHFDHFYCREVRLNTANVSFYIYYWLRQNSHNRLRIIQYTHNVVQRVSPLIAQQSNKYFPLSLPHLAFMSQLRDSVDTASVYHHPQRCFVTAWQDVWRFVHTVGPSVFFTLFMDKWKCTCPFSCLCALGHSTVITSAII